MSRAEEFIHLPVDGAWHQGHGVAIAKPVPLFFLAGN
jgi:hypothetical protein